MTGSSSQLTGVDRFSASSPFASVLGIIDAQASLLHFPFLPLHPMNFSAFLSSCVLELFLPLLLKLSLFHPFFQGAQTAQAISVWFLLDDSLYLPLPFYPLASHSNSITKRLSTHHSNHGPWVITFLVELRLHGWLFFLLNCVYMGDYLPGRTAFAWVITCMVELCLHGWLLAWSK